MTVALLNLDELKFKEQKNNTYSPENLETKSAIPRRLLGSIKPAPSAPLLSRTTKPVFVHPHLPPSQTLLFPTVQSDFSEDLDSFLKTPVLSQSKNNPFASNNSNSTLPNENSMSHSNSFPIDLSHNSELESSSISQENRNGYPSLSAVQVLSRAQTPLINNPPTAFSRQSPPIDVQNSSPTSDNSSSSKTILTEPLLGRQIYEDQIPHPSQNFFSPKKATQINPNTKIPNSYTVSQFPPSPSLQENLQRNNSPIEQLSNHYSPSPPLLPSFPTGSSPQSSPSLNQLNQNKSNDQSPSNPANSVNSMNNTTNSMNSINSGNSINSMNVSNSMNDTSHAGRMEALDDSFEHHINQILDHSFSMLKRNLAVDITSCFNGLSDKTTINEKTLQIFSQSLLNDIKSCFNTTELLRDVKNDQMQYISDTLHSIDQDIFKVSKSIHQKVDDANKRKEKTIIALGQLKQTLSSVKLSINQTGKALEKDFENERIRCAEQFDFYSNELESNQRKLRSLRTKNSELLSTKSIQKAQKEYLNDAFKQMQALQYTSNSQAPSGGSGNANSYEKCQKEIEKLCDEINRMKEDSWDDLFHECQNLINTTHQLFEDDLFNFAINSQRRNMSSQVNSPIREKRSHPVMKTPPPNTPRRFTIEPHHLNFD